MIDSDKIFQGSVFLKNDSRFCHQTLVKNERRKKEELFANEK